MISLVVALVILIAAVAFFQREALGRFIQSLFAQFNKLSHSAWNADPVAVYQSQIDASAREIADATAGLEQYRGLVSQYERKIANNQQDLAKLDARIKQYLNANDEAKAAEYAVMLQKTRENFAENQKHYDQYNSVYQSNLKKVQNAREKVANAKAKAANLKAELKLSQVEAEVTKLAQKFNLKTNTLDGLGEIESEIERQIDVNRGATQVAQDLSADDLAEIEAEKRISNQAAADILAEYKANLGKQHTCSSDCKH